MNYLIFFKIIANFFNVKKAEFHIVKKLFDVDDRFISELKEVKMKIISDCKSKNCENLFFPINENISNFNNKKNENFEMNEIKIDLNKENKNNLRNQNYNEQLMILKNKTSFIQENNIHNLKGNKFNSINNHSHKDKSISSLSELNSKRVILSDIPKINKIEDSTKKIDENKLDEFNRLLEVTAYIKKMQEIDLLKYLLFDENSIYMFNYLVGKINLFDFNQNSYNFKNKNLQFLIKKSLSDMKENTNMSFMNKKILKLFENFIENH